MGRKDDDFYDKDDEDDIEAMRERLAYDLSFGGDSAGQIQYRPKNNSGCLKLVIPVIMGAGAAIYGVVERLL